MVLNGVDAVADGGQDEEEHDDDDGDDDVPLDHAGDVGFDALDVVPFIPLLFGRGRKKGELLGVRCLMGGGWGGDFGGDWAIRRRWRLTRRGVSSGQTERFGGGDGGLAR